MTSPIALLNHFNLTIFTKTRKGCQLQYNSWTGRNVDWVKAFLDFIAGAKLMYCF